MEKKIKKAKKQQKSKEREVSTIDRCFVDPCGCYSYFVDPCGCTHWVNPCCC